MNRSMLFDSPFLLGFEHTRSLIERAAKAAAESYPPYNVEDRGDGGLRITLAVAGFSPDQLEVTVEDRQLGSSADATATPPGRKTPSSIAGSRREGSSAASCWPTAWRWRARSSSTASCISTWRGRSPKSGW